MARERSWATVLPAAVWLAVMGWAGGGSAAGQAAAASGGLNHVYGAFWEVGNGYSSTVVLNNAGQNALTAQITIYSHSGQAEQTVALPVAAHAVNRLGLVDVVKTQNDWGGVGVTWTGAVGAVAGQVVVNNSGNGSRLELPLQGGYRYDTENALYAPWWLPDAGSDGVVSLFNASGQRLTVTPSLGSEGGERRGAAVSLGPWQSQQVRLREWLGGSNETSGAVILRYAGAAHALQPALVVENAGTGFWLAPEFNARHRQASNANNQTTSWEFPQVRLLLGSTAKVPGSAAKSYALLSNGSGAALTPQVVAYYGDQKKSEKANLPLAALAAGETRVVELSQWVGGGLIPATVAQFGLSVTHAGQAGDLGMTLFSIDPGSGAVLRSEGAVLPPGVADSRYWNNATAVCLLPRAHNSGSGSVSAQATLYYPTALGVGAYQLPVVSVAGNQSKVLNLRQSVESGMRDGNGSLIPSGTEFGVLTLAANGSTATALNALSALCPAAESCAAGSDAAAIASAPSQLTLVAPPSCVPPPDPPYITSVSPTGAPFSTDNTVTIEGENLDDPGITINITGSVKASIQSETESEIVATFDTGGDTTVADQDLYLSSDDGHSNESHFQVGDKTPSGIVATPSVWPAGATTPVVITGTGFGTNPGVTFPNNPTIVWTRTAPAPTDTGATNGAKVTGTVTVPPCTLAGPVAITVTSNGYTGAGFVASTSGQSSSDDQTSAAEVSALAAPAPTISFGGKVISGTTSVVVGQQIALTGNIPSPQSGCVASQSWTTPTGTPVGGASASTASGFTVTAMPSNTNSTYTFYWVYPGTFSTTFKYTLSNGQSSAATTATFSVTGAGSMAPHPYTKVTIDALQPCGGGTLEADMVYGNITGTVCVANNGGTWGIYFVPSGAPSGGTYSYVQLLNTDTTTYTPTSGSAMVCPTSQGVDTSYPYKGIIPSTNPPQALDAPGVPLPSQSYPTVNRSFTATMFLLWTSSLANSITVPFGYQSWGFNGTAKCTTSCGTVSNWTATTNGTPGTIGSYTASAASQTSDGYTTLKDGFPQWSTVATRTCN